MSHYLIDVVISSSCFHFTTYISMLPRRVLKLLLGLLIGFWLGLILGFAASMALWYFLPTQWLVNGLADRKVRHEALLAGRQCKVNISHDHLFGSPRSFVEHCGLTVTSVTDILKSTTLQNIPWRSVFAGQMVVYMQGQACIEVAQRLNYLDMGRLGFEGYCMRFEGSHKHWAVSAKSYPSLITGVLR